MAEIERRKFLILTILSTLGLTLTGCFGGYENLTEDDLINLLLEKLNDNGNDGEEEAEEEDLGPVTLAMTYPAGWSPTVFTSGWVFGARCVAGAGTAKDTDLSDRVRWSGSGTFNPETGSTSRPVFSSPGAQTITISIDYQGKAYEKTVNLNAVSPAGYAHISSISSCPADSHGCPACPHPTHGPVTSGSPNVLINGLPAARVGDHGVAAACCGPNTFEIVEGDGSVLINGRPAAKIGSATKHCGGNGTITS
jgi:uncharacterized Zn-binding protein involved in type VI secretion